MLPTFLKAKIGRDVKFLSLGFALIFFGYNAVAQYLTTFFSSINLTNAGFKSLILIFIFFLVCGPLSAIFVVRFGAKNSMKIASLVYFLFILLLSSRLINLIYLMSIFAGAAAAFLWTGQNSYIVKASDEKSYGENSGFFNTALTIGSALGILVLGFLSAHFGFNKVFLLYSLFPLVGLVLLWKLTDLKVAEQKTNQLILMKKSIISPSALKISAFYFAFQFIFGLALGIIPLDITKNISTSAVGPLMFIFWIIPIFLSYFFGKISDIKGRNSIIYLSFITGVLGLAALYISQNAIFLVLGIVFLAIAYAIFRPIGFALVGDVASKKNLVSLSALFWMAQNVGVLLALLISSQIQTRAIYLISILTVLISLAVLLPILKVDPRIVKAKLAEEIK